MMVKVIVVGAGITGLSLGWYLKKHFGADLDLTIVEKSERAGGWIKTLNREGFLFDVGPRSCRTSGNAEAFLELIEDLNLKDQIIGANPESKSRYIYKDKKLQELPHSLASFFCSPLIKGHLKYFVRDFFALKKPLLEDESAYAFMERKFGAEITENLFASLVSGIYAGDIRKLSFKACFPSLYDLEKRHGSIMRGMLLKKKEKVHQPAIISFKNGMQTVIDQLASSLNEHLRLSTEVTKVELLKNKARVYLQKGEVLEGDYLFSCLPAHLLEPLLEDSPIKHALSSFHATSIASLFFGFNNPVLKRSGFGYLIPPKEKEKILGVVFDSSIFKEQNINNQTRLTVMIGGEHFQDFDAHSPSDFLKMARFSLSEHLGIKENPCFTHVEIAKKAIPQYLIGHEKRVFKLNEALPPHFKVIGASFSGVSVNDCVMNSRLCVKALIDCKKSSS